MHYYKFNIADWALHTSHLTLTEEATYFRLINFYYDSEQPIPIETQPVIRRLRLGNDPEIVKSILGEFFTETEKGFVHTRCEALLKEYRKTAKKNKVNGAKGGRPKKDVPLKETQEKPSGLDLGTQEEPKHNPNQELITINQEPLTTTKDIGDKSPAKAKRFVEPSLLDVQNYFLSKTNNREQSGIEGMKFHAYYESNGWKVGKNKMKSWQSAATGWITRNLSGVTQNENNGRTTTPRPDNSAAGRVRANGAKRKAEIAEALAKIERDDRPMADDGEPIRPQVGQLIR